MCTRLIVNLRYKADVFHDSDMLTFVWLELLQHATRKNPSILCVLFQIYSPDTGHCVYSLSDQDTLNSHLPVTCLRWKSRADTDSYGNILLATCEFSF